MASDITIRFPISRREAIPLPEFLRMDVATDTFLSEHPYHQQVHQLITWWCSTDEGMEVSTSGTTGTPKTIHFKREQIIAAASSSQALLGPTKGSNSLLAIDPGFTGGRMLLLRALLNGSDLTCLPPVANPLKQLMEAGVETDFDYASMVPYQINRILADPPSCTQLEKIKTLLIGGAPIAEKDWDILCGFPNRIVHTFGMTETLSHIALRRNKRYSGAYELLPGVDGFLNENNCLVIQAPWLGKVETNDLIEWVDQDAPKRSFRWLGRADRIINSGGHLVNPDAIDASFEGFAATEPAITGYFTAGECKESLGKQLILVVETNDSSEMLSSKINAFCAENLSKLDRPRRVLFTSKMELTGSGKTDRLATLRKLGCIVD